MTLDPDWLRSTVAGLAAQAGCDEIASASAWIAMACRVGPTPVRGPLKIDLLPPVPWAPRRWGLNVFDDAVIDLARSWASKWLGRAASAALDRLAASKARFAGGLVWDAGEIRLKLYAVDRFSALAQQAVQAGPGLIALGVDVGIQGAGRWRAYLPAPQLELDHPAARPWLAGHPEVEHHLLTVPAQPGGKLTQNWIFGPTAHLDDLRSLAQQLELGEVIDWCQHASQRLPTGGLRCAPVALEWDLFPDGSGQPDVLFTLTQST